MLQKDTLTSADKAALESAKAAYDKLGAQVQNYVPQAVKDKLNTTFPEEPVLANGYYTIGNGSVVIDILDVRYEDNIPAVSYQFLEQNNQLFYFEKLTDGKYKITAVHSKKALTMQTNGSVVQSHFAGADNQKWEIAKVGSQYTLKNFGQNRYLSVTGSSVSGVANATNLALTQKAGIQRIVHVVAVEDGTYQMQSVGSQLYVGAEYTSIADGARLTQQSATNTNSQKWTVKNHKDGKVYITSVHSQKMLDLDLPTNLCYQWVDGYNLNQRWYMESAGNDSYYVKNAAKDAMLAVADNTNGNQLTIKNRDENDHYQKWKFHYVTATEEVNQLENGYYTIGNDGVVIDMLDVRYEDNVPAVSWYFGEQNNQLFEFVKQDDGNYQIIAVHSKKSLTMQSNGSVVQSRWTGANNQKWRVTRDTQGNTYIANVANNQLLAVTKNGVTCNSTGRGWAQTLQLEQKSGVQKIVNIAAVEDGTYQIQSAASNLYIGSENGGTSDGVKVTQQASAQQWTVTNHKDDKVYITTAGNKMLDLDFPTNQCFQWVDGYNLNQRWLIETGTNGNFYVKNAARNVVLAAANTTSGSQLTVAAKSTADNKQLWKFIPA